MTGMREKTPVELELIDGARSLVPRLKARAAKAERDFKVPVETVTPSPVNA